MFKYVDILQPRIKLPPVSNYFILGIIQSKYGILKISILRTLNFKTNFMFSYSTTQNSVTYYVSVTISSSNTSGLKMKRHEKAEGESKENWKRCSLR